MNKYVFDVFDGWCPFGNRHSYMDLRKGCPSAYTSTNLVSAILLLYIKFGLFQKIFIALLLRIVEFPRWGEWDLNSTIEIQTYRVPSHGKPSISYPDLNGGLLLGKRCDITGAYQR